MGLPYQRQKRSDGSPLRRSSRDRRGRRRRRRKSGREGEPDLKSSLEPAEEGSDTDRTAAGRVYVHPVKQTSPLLSLDRGILLLNKNELR